MCSSVVFSWAVVSRSFRPTWQLLQLVCCGCMWRGLAVGEDMPVVPTLRTIPTVEEIFAQPALAPSLRTRNGS